MYKANLQKTIKNLTENGFSVFYVEKKEEVVKTLSHLLKKGDVVGVGGSVTLDECKILDFLRKGEYEFLDRYADNLAPEDIASIVNDSKNADVYLCSSNAVTENGELYNVDGRSNRISSIAHGPKSVVLVVSTDKIVSDLEQAVIRVKRIAAPKNCVRLDCDTYCKNNGECVSLKSHYQEMTDGCESADRICCNYLVSARQREKDRIKIIFVGEPCGY